MAQDEHKDKTLYWNIYVYYALKKNLYLGKKKSLFLYKQQTPA